MRVAESVVGLEVENGLLRPEVVRVEASGQLRACVRLPPRYRTREAAVANAFGALPVREAALVRGLLAAWRWVKAQLSQGRARGCAVQPSPSAAP